MSTLSTFSVGVKQQFVILSVIVVLCICYENKYLELAFYIFSFHFSKLFISI